MVYAERGGPRKGTGRPPRPPEFVRSAGLRVNFFPRELRDLEAIAEAWDVPLATAVWALLHDKLANLHKRAPKTEDGLAVLAAAALRSVRLSPEGPPSNGAEAPPE